MPSTATETVVVCPNCGTKNRVDVGRSHSQKPVCGKCKRELPLPDDSAGPIVLTDSSFESTLKSAGNKPVLVDCWAPWCGPCRVLGPVVDELAREAGGKFVVAKLNTDENPHTASRFRINAIPTMLIFKNGQLADQLVGLHPKQAIEQRLAAQISG